ncbi:MAG TPA: hypothetical protein DCE82_02825, partial [Odoribacter splanchnicus]|nr:hypothetical protein [Odoribacter splanchnicus]
FESRPHRLIKTEKIRKVLRFNTLGLFLFPLTQAKVSENSVPKSVYVSSFLIFAKLFLFLIK